MENIMIWVLDNKEWLFSGAGLLIISWISRLIFLKWRTNYSSQSIRSDKNSINIQAGRDSNFGAKNKRDDVEEN